MPQYRNPSKRPVTLTILHADAPRTQVQFDSPVHDPRTGEVAMRQIDRRLPESVTLLGGEARELPAYARKEALRQGLVEVEPEQQKKDEGKPDDKAQPAPESAPELPNALKRKKGA